MKNKIIPLTGIILCMSAVARQFKDRDDEILHSFVYSACMNLIPISILGIYIMTKNQKHFVEKFGISKTEVNMINILTHIVIPVVIFFDLIGTVINNHSHKNAIKHIFFCAIIAILYLALTDIEAIYGKMDIKGMLIAFSVVTFVTIAYIDYCKKLRSNS